ncbi:CD225/dispanin family protein [Amycolatopsis sp., V23-08]|uniref:CD225/dispanin family protein n=1 Tax=Amycolatopsis heterodermiae TaxID=3110235 RepID=A0ABU5RJT4_9PSEU|nr:CD225/dispanin family protein [Amycolatopsis sp., V23-08]MEA5366551.1 CD225/dispanin family protein [Amycolatopsis sp., V23-08]
MTEPARPPADYNPGPPPSSNLAWGIVAAIICLPFGIVSIFQAAKVERLWAQGDPDAARHAAGAARRWAIIGAVVGVVLWVLVVVGGVLLLGTLLDDAASH